MPTSLGLHGLYAPRFTVGDTKWAPNYEARYINANTLAGCLAGCRTFYTLRS